MRTVSWGLVHIPLVEDYRVCFCWRRPLAKCVSGCGWRMFLQNALRLVLLVAWGMNKIDYDLPQTATKIIGVYVEIGILAIQLLDGVLTIASSWFENLKMLYPLLVVIPVCFVIDFSVKASCYGALFLWPHVTAFGVFSLVEVWFRNFSQMYCWIAVISFLHESKDKKNPFRDEEAHSVLRKTSSSIVTSPFSRSSTLSIRGQRSFLLKSKNSKHVDDEAKTANETEEQPKLSDDRSSLLSHRTGESDDNNRLSPDAFRSLSDNFSFQRASATGRSPSQPRYKRVRGFVPEVLRSPGPPKGSAGAPTAVEPPALPSLPPIGGQLSRDNWTSSTEAVKPELSFVV